MDNQIKVLAVDDEKFNLLLLQSCLKNGNYLVKTCSNALEALDVFKRNKFDVILLDIMMAGIDGFEVRKLVREINRDIPIIFLTSMVDDLNSTLLGRIADDQYSYYMNKSFNKKTLMTKIDQVVASYHEHHAFDRYYRKLEENLTLAGDVQKVMLPQWCIDSDQMEMSYLYLPSMKVSGDMLETVRIDESRLLFFVGDIAGHGVQAALYMSAIQSFLKALLFMGDGVELVPHTILNGIENFFRNDLGSKNYMTCIVAIFDFEHNRLSYQSAGHPGMIRCRANSGEAHVIDTERGGLPIGLARGTRYVIEDTVELDFDDDDFFAVYTDGIMDLNNSSGDNVNESLFLDMFGSLADSADLISIPFRMLSALEQIGYSVMPDDICLAVIRKRKAQPRQMTRVIGADTAEVSACVMEFSGFVRRIYPNERMATSVELLLSEFLNNVVIHGLESRKNTQTCIFIRLDALEKAVRIRVLDRGCKWSSNPALHASAELLESRNAARATSGRGIAIIYSIASSIVRNHYSGLNETVFLIKNTEKHG